MSGGLTSESSKPHGPEECRERALRLLERKPHSRADLSRKLRQRKFSRNAVEAVLNDFERVGLLDDAALARQHCETRLHASPPVGRRRVFQELRRHGIPQDIAEDALREVWDEQDDDWELQRAMEAARRKLRVLGTEKDPRKLRDKLYRHLAGRGFPADAVRQAVEASLDDPAQ